jgi:hypothetical protein
MTADPLHIGRRDEVLGWIDQGHGRGAGMAVSHFAPGVTPELHARMMERVRGWMKTRKKRAKGGKRGMEAREKPPPGGEWRGAQRKTLNKNARSSSFELGHGSIRDRTGTLGPVSWAEL